MTSEDQIWYHGSGAWFNQFDPSKNKKVQPGDKGKHWNSYLGFHLTDKKPVANEFARRQNGWVYTVRLELDFPVHYDSEYDMDEQGARWAIANGYDIDLTADWMKSMDPDEWQFHINYSDACNTIHRKEASRIAQGFREHLIEQGYDGILYGNEYEQASHGFPSEGRHLCAIGFLPQQITVLNRERHARSTISR